MKNLVKKHLTKKSNAFLTTGLSDLGLGLLIALVIAAAVMTYFYSTQSSSNVLQFQADIIQISSKVSTLFSGSTGYGDLSNEVAIKGGAVPATLIKGNNIVNTWGGTITLFPSDDESSFFIKITNMPDEECSQLAGNRVNKWASIAINGSTLSEDSSTVDVINLCSNGKNTITYEAR